MLMSFEYKFYMKNSKILILYWLKIVIRGGECNSYVLCIMR